MNSVVRHDRGHWTQALIAGAILGAAYLIFRNRPAAGSIDRVPSGRADLLAFRVAGRIDKAAIQRMAEQVLDAFDRFDQVDMIVLMEDFRGMTLGASLDPANLWSQARALAKVGRYAVVGAPDAAEGMIELMDRFIPVDARTFEGQERNAAWAWVRGKA